MADKKTIEVSDGLYKAFLDLKVKVSELAKDNTITDENLVGFMVQEISNGIAMMEVNNKNDNGNECCGGHEYSKDHQCCGKGDCFS